MYPETMRECLSTCLCWYAALHSAVSETVPCSCMYRYAVVLNGWDTIHEAFVKNGLTFADRYQFYFEKAVMNPRSKGRTVRAHGRDIELEFNGGLIICLTNTDADSQSNEHSLQGHLHTILLE